MKQLVFFITVLAKQAKHWDMLVSLILIYMRYIHQKLFVYITSNKKIYDSMSVSLL